jgi:hypothetical protein
MLKQVPAALKMIVVGDVSIPFVGKFQKDNGSIVANDILDDSAGDARRTPAGNNPTEPLRR